MKRLLISILCCLLAITGNTQPLTQALKDSFIIETVKRYYETGWEMASRKDKKMLLLNRYDSSWTLPGPLHPYVILLPDIDAIKAAVVQPPYNGRSMYYHLRCHEAADTFDITITYSSIRLNPPGSKYQFSGMGICQNGNPYARYIFNRETQTWLFKNRDQLDYEEQLDWAGIPAGNAIW